ncbi:MAG: hypothetical protein HY316_05115 [Acidobacteria bacterium]|nr:hypothetical protein [Acidobacteriota bacterium]
MGGPRDSEAAASAAMLTAATMIAHQVGGKATRDALFLSYFDISSLPYMFIGAAIISIATVFAFSRLLTHFGPLRVLPVAFAMSAAFLFGERAVLNLYPRLTSVIVYSQMAGLGGVLISGFWSVVNERFDPRTAKRQFGRIAAGATFGGLLGGLLAERVAEALSVGAMLPILGSLHLFCAWRIVGVGLQDSSHPAASGKIPRSNSVHPNGNQSVWKIMREAPYLRNLAVLVSLSAVSSLGLDYVFKAQAVGVYGTGENLLRFFAIFYTLVALGTFIVQTTLSRHFLERLGLARTVGSLPLAVYVGGVGAAAIPGLPSAALARGLGAVTNDSLFRSGYEILYTPIPAAEKRATKSFVDVGCERLGDLVGGVLIWSILFSSPVHSIPMVLAVAMGLSIAGLWFTRRLDQGYIVSLERGLRNRAVELDLAEVQDSTTRSAVLRTANITREGTLVASYAASGSTVLSQAAGINSEVSAAGRPQPTDPVLADPVARKVAALRSGDARKVRQVLEERSSLDVTLAPHLISLLAWDEMAPHVVPVLRQAVPRIAGQLVDTLLDPEQPFAVHRRIPRVLSAAASQRAADGLLQGLAHKRFEVRFQCGLALAVIAAKSPEIHINPEIIFLAVRREATAGKKLWDSHQLLDRAEEQEAAPFVDDVLRARSSKSMEHVFRLLSLVLAKEPLRIAFRGLHAGDENLRGIVLEYLERVLPPAVREPLWPYLEDHRPQQRGVRSQEEILATLIRSHESIELDLAALKEKLGSGQPS